MPFYKSCFLKWRHFTFFALFRKDKVTTFYIVPLQRSHTLYPYFTKLKLTLLRDSNLVLDRFEGADPVGLASITTLNVRFDVVVDVVCGDFVVVVGVVIAAVSISIGAVLK